jgi:hypothetical protein
LLYVSAKSASIKIAINQTWSNKRIILNNQYF